MELYLDNASTTIVNPKVQELYISLLQKNYGSTGSLHKLGEQALALETNARQEIANLLHVNFQEIFFNSGATEGNNHAIKGVAFQYKNRGNTLITTKVEHPSVLECFKQLEENFGFHVIYLDVNEHGQIELEDLKKALNNDVILVSIMFVNNEVGTIMPIKEIANILKQYPKIIFHCDITQAIGKLPIDFQWFDLATLSFHKIHGLKGCGLLYKKQKVKLVSLLNGHPAQNTLKAGTSPWQNHVANALALKFELEEMRKKQEEVALTQKKLLNELSKIPEITLNTEMGYTIPNIINFSIKGYNPEVVIRQFSNMGIYLSSKSACSVALKDSFSPTLLAMHKDNEVCRSSIRVSMDHALTESEIKYFIDCLKQILKIIRK